MYNIISAGVDHNLASINLREKFSLTKSKQIEFYQFLKGEDFVCGGVVISTCNRTEVFLSLEIGTFVDPFELLVKFLGEKFGADMVQHKIYRGKQVISHLCMLACGGKSQIFGEDQIITQIKTGLLLSRECGTADAVTEVLFRTGITCGKKIKTQLNLTKRETSVADFVIEKIKTYCENVSHVLVIGNGEMGRHMATRLVENNINVVMSIRRYKHSDVILPSGCTGVDFYDIYSQMESVDAVVSATLSPHHTIKREYFQKLQNPPKYLFDLAVPRDIAPDIADMSGISVFDVDMLSCDKPSENKEKLIQEMNVIIEKYIKDFEKWNEYKAKSCKAE